jgi:pimeloyl-ACP methyl ester carboxylesterase/predicted glycosyltransferase
VRALEPTREGHVERAGARIGYECFGEGDRTVLFLPTWTIVHSRLWKNQVPYLARDCHVVTFDAVGNGRSDRSLDPDRHRAVETANDALAVLDAVGVERATLVGASRGGNHALHLWDLAPERVAGIVLIAPSVPVDPPREVDVAQVAEFAVERDHYEGWQKANAHYWRRDYRGWLEFFFSQVFTEARSTKPIEDGVTWGLETSADVLLASVAAPDPPAEEHRRIAETISCPMVVIHGDEDVIAPHSAGARLADATGATLVTLHGSGHSPQARDPVKVNRLLGDFLRVTPRPDAWARGRSRPRRALFISSPIGLGHVLRDVAVARELRALVPDLEVHWLAQDPVTRVLEAEGEIIHPASCHLALESQHIESESGEHDLHAFEAFRRMDEILVNNFMVFSDVVDREQYDVWVGDEAWELDYFLHENPELKRAPYCWLTDFVGWLPMPDGGEREAYVAADYNAEMIEHIARYPRLRDRALFVGSPDDIVPDTFGDGLPAIRAWTEEHFDFVGYISGFSPDALGAREELRDGLGYAPDERVCIATVGGSGVGSYLLQRIVDAFPAAKRALPELRLVVVAGPRIDTSAFAPADGLDVQPYVHHLYEHLSACDLAVIQGGLTTAMELTASRRPFVYVPLRHHFEQNTHVRHRLDRYRAGRCLEYDDATADALADVIARECGRVVDYRPVERDGAARAAARIAEVF